MEVEAVGGRAALLAGAAESGKEMVGVLTVLSSIASLVNESMAIRNEGTMLVSQLMAASSWLEQ